MTETPNFGLPLIQPSQAQKHVTVNEAFVLLDGIAQLSLIAVDQVDPPTSFTEGDCYVVPAGATGAWEAQQGQIAIASNGGWVFAVPREGWRAWVIAEGREYRFEANVWRSANGSSSPSGAGMNFETIEADVDLTGSGAQDVLLDIPANAMVFAASARVIEEITGGLTAWEFGTIGAENRFGSGMGTALGSYATGILSAPTTYYSQTALRFTPLGGDVSGGRLRIALSYASFSVPAGL